MRLESYDYSQNGAYFITICTKDNQHILGEISRGGALLRPLGEICEAQIVELQRRYGVVIDKWVIMPNHIHMLLVVERAEQSPAPTVPNVVCSYKSITTKLANAHDEAAGRRIWQRSFYEHIIRNDIEYREIWQYIDANPRTWAEDRFYFEQIQ